MLPAASGHPNHAPVLGRVMPGVDQLRPSPEKVKVPYVSGVVANESWSLTRVGSVIC